MLKTSIPLESDLWSLPVGLPSLTVGQDRGGEIQTLSIELRRAWDTNYLRRSCTGFLNLPSLFGHFCWDVLFLLFALCYLFFFVYRFCFVNAWEGANSHVTWTIRKHTILIGRVNQLEKKQSTTKINGKSNLPLRISGKNKSLARIYGKPDLRLNAMQCEIGV